MQMKLSGLQERIERISTHLLAGLMANPSVMPEELILSDSKLETRQAIDRENHKFKHMDHLCDHAHFAAVKLLEELDTDIIQPEHFIGDEDDEDWKENKKVHNEE